MEEAANTRLNFLKSYLNNMDSQTNRGGQLRGGDNNTAGLGSLAGLAHN